MLCHPVGELMADNVYCDRKTVENTLGFGQILIPVAIDHLDPVPEGIVVSGAEVHGRIEA